jgi:hypothetical protein
VLTVQVREERGDIVLRGKRRFDWENLQHISDDEFPLLGGLLPYGDTMFNARQAVKVRQEVGSPRIRELLGDDAVKEIVRLCLAVEGGSHLYLWFLGD